MMKSFRLLMSIALLTILLATPTLAQVVNPGIDVFKTPASAGSNVDFAGDPIPIDFFCPGSPEFTGTVFLKGVPLVTEPVRVAGTTDTIVERLAAIPADGSTTPIVVRALNLKHTQELTIDCDDTGSTQFGVWVHADTAAPSQDDSVMQIYPASFTSYLVVPAIVKFYRIDDETIFSEVSHEVHLAGSGPWSDNPGSNAIKISNGFLVDADGDGAAETEVPGTSNFHAGWDGQTRAMISEAERWAKHKIKPPKPLIIAIPTDPVPVPGEQLPGEPVVTIPGGIQ
ncbi:MAG: hypothetical protein GY856_29015 [bacterium]|nr:hypothetical protein [bacterium]